MREPVTVCMIVLMAAMRLSSASQLVLQLTLVDRIRHACQPQEGLPVIAKQAGLWHPPLASVRMMMSVPAFHLVLSCAPTPRVHSSAAAKRVTRLKIATADLLV